MSCNIKERDAALTYQLRIKKQYTDSMPDYTFIRGSFVVFDMIQRNRDVVIIVVNWQTGNVFKLISTVSIGQSVTGFFVNIYVVQSGYQF